MSLKKVSSWVCWFSMQPKKCAATEFSKIFEQGLIKLCQISPSSTLISFYSHLVNLSDLTIGCSFYIFREGIRPLGEENKNGACGIIKLERKQDFIDNYWERLVSMCSTEKWSNFVVGISANSKLHQIVIQVGISQAQDTFNCVAQEIRAALDNQNLDMTLKYHDESLISVSSSKDTFAEDDKNSFMQEIVNN